MTKTGPKLALVLVAVGWMGSVWADTYTVAALATAAVVTPLTVTKAADMKFGTFAATGGAECVMQRTTTALSAGSAVKVHTGAALTAATFAVRGGGARTFAIVYDGSSTALHMLPPCLLTGQP